GSVVGGRVLDEDGDPMPGVMVTVQRYQYLQGDKRLVPAGTSQTDDKGQYRVWGLMPGDYYVNASARNFAGFGGRGRRGGNAGPAGPGLFVGGFAGGFGGRGGAAPQAPTPGGEEAVAYVPTYFPGVSSVAEARPVTAGVGGE